MCSFYDLYKLLQYKIQLRNRAQSHIIYKRKNFSGSFIEKAYLIGFRIGDLRVRKFYRNSETILVDCGSTKIDQVNLIKKLFSKYGRVWIGKPNKRGSIQIQCHLNTSFNFLLSKEPGNFIFNHKKYFFAFLAGFTDAEGSIFISSKRANYALGNYDLELLQKLKSYLEKFGIKSHQITHSIREGLLASHGYRYNHDYWTLTISKKVDLISLFHLIGLNLKHRNRVKQMKLAIKNIEERNKLYAQK